MNKRGPADAIVALARHEFDLVHDGTGEAWAVSGARAFRIGSQELNDRLILLAIDEDLKAPSKYTLTTAANALAAMARLTGPERTIGLRAAGYQGRVILDLGDDENRVVRVGPDGWEVVTSSPLAFHRPAGMAPQVVPEHGGSLDDLRELLAVGEDDFRLMIGWLVGCLNPSGSKPVLELVGMQGSGKSMRARMLRTLFDPCGSQLQTMPADLRNLAVLAFHRALLVFDNVSTIPEELSDGLCRLTTGAGFDHRRNCTDDGLITFPATRPLIITGIPDSVKASDLADRTIRIVLPEMGEADRSTEAEVWRRFEQVRPRVLGVLLDAVSCALRDLDSVVLRESPRMLDFATWVEAGSPGLGWERDAFLDAYLENRRESSATVVDSSYLGRFIPTLAAQGFTGTDVEALAELARIAGPDAVRHKAWPIAPTGALNILRRLAPPLRDQGILVEFPGLGASGRQLIRVGMMPDPDAAPAEVLPLVRPTGDRAPADEVVSALRAVGVDPSWPAAKAATLAMRRSVANVELAVAALNAIGVPAPSGAPWTPEILRAVI